MGHAPKSTSGVDLIDETWGGLYQGGSYLVYGRTASNRGLIPLLFAARGGQACLYFTSSGDLNRRAQESGIEPGHSIEIGGLPRFDDPLEVGDEQLASALSDVVTRVETARPERVVIDDFMPFVAFQSFDRFRSEFISMLERVDVLDATFMLIMAEPANAESEAVIEFMRHQMTGALHVRRPDKHPDSTVRLVEFLPNIGHAGRALELEWDVRRWLRPPDPTSRRFRFSEEAGPSPRQARWADDESAQHPTGPASTEPDRGSPAKSPNAVPAIRLGTGGPSGPARADANGSEWSGPATRYRAPSTSASRISRIPLGGTSKAPQPGVSTAARRDASTAAQPSAFARTSVLEPESFRGSSAGRPSFEPVRLADSPHYRTSHTDREAFRARLQKSFLRNHVDGTPFVLIAMRMDRPLDRERRPFDFDFILDLVSESLRESDDMLVDLERERLVVMLAESRRDASQPFFGRLKNRLQEEAPQEADYLMQSVSAIVVPNGEPFRSAEEFLTYALDEE